MTTNEFDVIDRYFKDLSAPDGNVSLGPGDDCAVLKVPPGMEVCVSTDTLLEGVHFLPDSSPKTIAARVLGANLSDLAAMGAEPLGCVLALTLPEPDEQWLAAFAESLSVLTRKYDAPLVGGNLAKGTLSLTMTVMGCVPAGTAVTRHGASPGEDIYVTGSLGDAAKGLELLKSGGQQEYLVARYCEPTPRLQAGLALRDIATAMIDISDGLIAELGHMCEDKVMGAEVLTALVPLSEPLLSTSGFESAVRMALFAGDDYELCFTAPSDKSRQIQDTAQALNLPMTCIGKIMETPGVNARHPDGEVLVFGGSGYQHF